jgi:hypothetical protein
MVNIGGLAVEASLQADRPKTGMIEASVRRRSLFIFRRTVVVWDLAGGFDTGYRAGVPGFSVAAISSKSSF